jgi:hypothetical protein
VRPGYYIVTHEAVLAGPNLRHPIRLHKGDWLVTDGEQLGRFDTEELDWVPLDWARGTPVTLDATITPMVEAATIATNPQRLESQFHETLFIEPGEPLPDLPRPTLSQLGPYLRIRRNLVAYTYDRRL